MSTDLAVVEEQALVVPPNVLAVPPMRLLISYPDHDVVTKQGFPRSHFYTEVVSPSVLYKQAMEVAVLLRKGPVNKMPKDLQRPGPRAYFQGPFQKKSRPICKSEDGLVPVQPYEGEPQLQPKAATCAECLFSQWDNETQPATPPACKQRLRLYLADVDSGLRFILDINAGIKSYFRASEMLIQLQSTVAVENAITKKNKPEYSYSTIMKLGVGEDNKEIITFSTVKPIKHWERFIPLYEDLVKPKVVEKVQDEVDAEIETEVLDGI